MNGHEMSVRKRLFDMEIDEISLVDRGANQHAAIVISKADGFEEDGMPAEIDVLYDSDGDLVDYELEHGDVVYDEQGNQYVYVIEDDDEDGDYGEYGKSEDFSKEKTGIKWIHDIPQQAKWAHSYANEQGKKAVSSIKAHPKEYGIGTAVGAGTTAAAATAGSKIGNKNKKKEAPMEPAKKSLGDVVLEELSKAASEDERSEIIAKAMEEVEIAKEQANEAWGRVAEQEDAMLESAFISKAAEYNLPVNPIDFGQILKAASTVLDYEQLDLLDQLFSSVGEALYEEIGYVGDTDNTSVMDVVNGYVGDIIGKSDATPEMIQSAVFEANPDAYDAYLAENRW